MNIPTLPQSMSIRAPVALLLLALLPGGATGQSGVDASAAAPADVASPEAVVEALYETVQRRPGEDFDWDRARTLFLPQALMIPNPEQTGGEHRVMSPEEFFAWIDAGTTVGGPDDPGFAEEEIHSVVERYGDVAHVFSTYEKRFWGDDEVLGRGINSIQLLFRDGRWWVTSIAWDEETGAGPIPPEYRPGG